MQTIRRKSFVGPNIYFRTGEFAGCKGLNAFRDVIRDRAQSFINDVVGPDYVVSVTEHAMTFGPFSVVVWYRDFGQEPKPYRSIDDLE